MAGLCNRAPMTASNQKRRGIVRANAADQRRRAGGLQRQGAHQITPATCQAIGGGLFAAIHEAAGGLNRKLVLGLKFHASVNPGGSAIYMDLFLNGVLRKSGSGKSRWSAKCSAQHGYKDNGA